MTWTKYYEGTWHINNLQSSDYLMTLEPQLSNENKEEPNYTRHQGRPCLECVNQVQ